jgi:subtilase family serine protease
MRRRPHRVRTGVATLGAATLVAISGIAAGTASAAVKRQAIPGTHPGWATKANLRPDHTVPVPAGDITVNVYLNSQNPTGLEQFAAAVSNPSSPQYDHYLNAAQAQNEFGPTRAEAHAVANEFTADGLVVTDQQLGFGGFVQVAGTEAQIESVFDVSFGAFTDPEGDIVRAPTQAATLPASIAGDVAAVAGLDSGNHFMTPDNSFGTARHRHQPPPVDPVTGVGSNGPVPPNDSGPASALPPPPANFYVAPPDSLFYGQLSATNEPAVNGQFQPWEVNGYIPGQIRGAYGVTNSGATGRGATVAVVDAYASPTMRSDADQFARVTGDQPFGGNQYEQHLASNFDFINECGASGWYGEETLDVEAVHGMAPNANVRYYGAADCTDIGLLAPEAQIVNTDSAQIVTNSWGEPADDESLSTVYDQVFQAGATEGIGFFFSSGDSGYEDPAYEDPGSDQIQVDYPTSSPWVTSVGGTSLAVGRQNNYEFETPWGTVRTGLSADGLSWDPAPPVDPMAGYDGSGGGGVSTQYTQPAYQAGVVPNSLATDVPEGSTTTPMRVIPDISAYADPSTGTLVGQTVLLKDGVHFGFALSRIGGTSLSTPTMAGIEADAQQAAGHALGFANPAIYQRAGTSAFHDVDEPATPQFEVRNDFTDPATATGPLVTTLRQLGINGAGASALTATPGFDDATGVGSPQNYISSFFGRR